MSDYELPIRIRAYKLNQPAGENRALYATKLPVGLLTNEREFAVDIWKKEKGITSKQGYQREPTRPRLLKIAKFISEDEIPIFPTTILLSSREKLDFETADGENGFLTIKHPLWIVDGQHRIFGIRLAINERGIRGWEDKELPVVILDNFDKEYETLQFFILNTTQKRVPTDLAQRLLRKIGLEDTGTSLAFREGDDWIPKALQVVDLLGDTSDKNNVWYGRIKSPNQKKLPSHIINQTSMVTSLKPLLKDGSLQPYLPNDIYKILRNFWHAVKLLLPEVFADPRRYVIQKTPGTFALHDLANRIILGMGKDFKPTSFEFILKDVFTDGFGDEVWWRAKGDGAAIYNSMKGFKILANMLERKIPEGKIVGEIMV